MIKYTGFPRLIKDEFEKPAIEINEIITKVFLLKLLKIIFMKIKKKIMNKSGAL